MRHSFIDAHSDGDSPFHRLHPAVKLAAAAAGVLCIVTTPPRAFASFGAYAATLAAVLLLARVPLAVALRRLLAVIPFAVLVAAFLPFVGGGRVLLEAPVGPLRLAVTAGGLLLFWNVVVKAALSTLCMTALVATTPFDRLLAALETLRCPRLLVMVLAFMYRYLFVLTDEAMRLARAREARDPGGGHARAARALAGIVGVLFVRAYERAERVYLAMCARGFDGTIVALPPPPVRRADALFLAAAGLAFGAGRLAGGAF
ncbi:MAG: cobalt ECF transporter T component CbiQ [bacterium]|nr:cobalt ECF transporter T component CbiQ [bacterium]